MERSQEFYLRRETRKRQERTLETQIESQDLEEKRWGERKAMCGVYCLTFLNVKSSRGEMSDTGGVITHKKETIFTTHTHTKLKIK